MKHTILFLAANPSDTERLALDKECAEIERELQMTRGRDDFELRSKWAVSAQDLMRHLNDLQPAIVHFSGHGSDGSSSSARVHGEPQRDVASPQGTGIYLQDDGRSQYVSEHALAQMIASASPSTRLVVLNACYSAAIGEALRTPVGCVVGMVGALSDAAARSFAVAFYRALGNHRSVANAIAQAVALLGAERRDALPVCKTRDGLRAEEVFLGRAGSDRLDSDHDDGRAERPDHPEEQKETSSTTANSASTADERIGLPSDFKQLMSEGQNLDQRGDLVAAAAGFVSAHSAATTAEEQEQALLWAARVELQRRDTATAEHYLKMARELGIGDLHGIATRTILEARRLRFSNQPDKARETLRKVERPSDPFLLAELAYEQGALENDATVRRLNFQQALERYDAAGHAVAAARTMLMLGQSEIEARKLEDARHHFENAAKEFERLNNTHGRAHVQVCVARLARHQDNYVQSHDAASAALAMAMQHGFADLEIQSLLERAHAAAEIGDLDAAEQDANGIRVREHMPPLLVAHATTLLGVIAGHREDFQEAYRRLEQAEGTYRTAEATSDLRRCQLWRARLHLDVRDAAAARRLISGAKPEDSTADPNSAMEMVVRARLSLTDGDETALDQLRAFEQHYRKTTRIEAGFYRADYLIAHAKVDVARPLVDQLRALALELRAKNWVLRIDEIEGRLLLAEGRPEDARRVFIDAADRYRQVRNTRAAERCLRACPEASVEKPRSKAQQGSTNVARWERIVGVCVGSVALAGAVLLVTTISHPTQLQTVIYCALFAVAVGAIGEIVLGYAVANYRIGRVSVRLVGGAAMAAITFWGLMHYLSSDADCARTLDNAMSVSRETAIREAGTVCFDSASITINGSRAFIVRAKTIRVLGASSISGAGDPGNAGYSGDDAFGGDRRDCRKTRVMRDATGRASWCTSDSEAWRRANVGCDRGFPDNRCDVGGDGGAGEVGQVGPSVIFDLMEAPQLSGLEIRLPGGVGGAGGKPGLGSRNYWLPTCPADHRELHPLNSNTQKTHDCPPGTPGAPGKTGPAGRCVVRLAGRERACDEFK